MSEERKVTYQGIDYELTEEQWEDCLKAAEYIKRAQNQEFLENELVDIRTVTIDRNKPPLFRIVDYILQIKNPYFYKVGATKVRVSYADTDRTVTDCFLDMIELM